MMQSIFVSEDPKIMIKNETEHFYLRRRKVTKMRILLTVTKMMIKNEAEHFFHKRSKKLWFEIKSRARYFQLSIFYFLLLTDFELSSHYISY